jgi:hypothetical protein
LQLEIINKNLEAYYDAWDKFIKSWIVIKIQDPSCVFQWRLQVGCFYIVLHKLQNLWSEPGCNVLCMHCAVKIAGWDCYEGGRQSWNVWWWGMLLARFMFLLNMNICWFFIVRDIYRWEILFLATCQHTRHTFLHFTRKVRMDQILNIY